MSAFAYVLLILVSRQTDEATIDRDSGIYCVLVSVQDVVSGSGDHKSDLVEVDYHLNCCKT